jgi:hypothetical protein
MKLNGLSWKSIQKEHDIRYLINTYRVLLTRARKGIVIFVPPGDDKDPTLLPLSFDQTYNFLIAAGATPAVG